ncbi:hypothetical protein ACF0H5_018415 [Mactra antiquata]
MNVSGMRHPYLGIDFKFDVKDLASKDPLKQFDAWFQEACDKKVVEEPNAMSLATATKNGLPSVRMVLCKGFSEEGFTFYTNYDSRKGVELAENPVCSIMFYWEPLKRSVRIMGNVEKISEEKSTEYFNSRPYASRLGALVSNQSKVIPDRQTLDDKLKNLQEQYSEDDSIKKPHSWGGYLIRPYEYEFWQGQTNRLHDRLRFRKLESNEKFDSTVMSEGEKDWIIERLSS